MIPDPTAVAPAHPPAGTAGDTAAPRPVGNPHVAGDSLPATANSDPLVRPVAIDLPSPGMVIGEFELRRELGRGAFGRVFLADQKGLNRRVALKVSLGHEMTAEEGRSLGGLEHDHIVKVYSTFTAPGTNWHCLCLQYVPGTDLRGVIARLHHEGAPSGGRAILDAVDAAGWRDVGFDPAALRDREALAADDFSQAVCRIGGRLAEALAFAHGRGVLHCDVKPANILVTPYGRPLLADFNVAFDRSKHDRGVGGTAAYMAPEHLAASASGAAGSVDERCDIFSLGVVLHELATGARPDPRSDSDPLAALPHEITQVIRRCLEPDPAARYATATELAAALDGAWHLLAARRALPNPSRFGRWVVAYPVWALAIAGLLPHLAGSVLNISYNSVQIELNRAQEAAFDALVIGYNGVVYTACAAYLYLLLRRIGNAIRALPTGRGVAADELRRRCRHLGWVAIGLGCVGWFPGAVLFPLGIDLGTRCSEPIDADKRLALYGHFAVSFVLSGLIGVVFSFLGVMYVMLRAVFPIAGNPDTYHPGQIGAELRPLAWWFGPFVLLASAVPLTGAMMLVSLSDERITLPFRLLVVGLIGFGVVAVGMAERLTRRIMRLAAVWDVDNSPQ